MSRKKSLKDMLDAGLGDITGAQEATRSIVNRQVAIAPPPAAPPVVEPPPVSVDTVSAQSGKKEAEIPKEDETENQNVNQDVNLKVYQNLNPDKSLVLLEVEKPPKFYDTHKNESFLVRKDIMGKVNALCKKGGRGFKTKFVNEALRAHLLRYGVEVPE